jgi:hypothetical protein
LNYILWFLRGDKAVAARLADAPPDDLAAILRPASCHSRQRVTAFGAGAGDALAAAVLAGVEL